VTVRRRLSPTERLVWAAGEVLPVNFAVTARITGRAHPARIRDELAALRRRHPLLGVRLDAPGRWQAWLTSDDVPDPDLRVATATSPDAWTQVVEQELQLPFDTATGPLARFVLLDHGDAFDLVCVYHHLVADVLSAAFVVRDLLDHVAAPRVVRQTSAPRAAIPPPAAAPATPPADDLLPGRRTNPADLLRLARALGGPPPPRPARAAGPLTYTTWSLPPEETAALLSRCRAERTTLQAALCAAFAQAYGRPIRIAVPADLRRILTPSPQEAMGLYASTVFVTADPATSRQDLRAAIHHQLRPGELVPLVRVFRLLRPVPRRTLSALLLRGETKGARFDISLSNVRVPITQDYGPLRLDALYGAAHTSLSGAPLVLVTGHGGRLFFGVTSTDGAAVAELCERAMSRLRSPAILLARPR
jgi:hypothetical protein